MPDAHDVTTEPIVVTGAGGMIGRRVCAQLVAAGARDLVGLVGPVPHDPADPPIPARWHHGDIADPEVCARLVEDATTIVHLAGPPSVGASHRAPAEAVRAHGLGTATLLEAAVRTGRMRRVVLVSSAEVYGLPRDQVVTESHPLAPASPYAVAKASAEMFATMMQAIHGFELAIVRPFAVYGPTSPAWSLVGTAVGQALTGAADEPVVMRDLTRIRDLVHVDDVAALIARCAVHAVWAADQAPLVVNACTGVASTVQDVALAALAAAGRRAPVHQEPAGPEPTAGQLRAGHRPPWLDPVRLVGSPGRAADLLDWSPSRTLADGMEELVAHRRAAGDDRA